VEPLIPVQPVIKRQDRRKIALTIGAGCLVLGSSLWIVLATRQATPQAMLATLPPVEMGPLPPVSTALNIPRNYQGLRVGAAPSPASQTPGPPADSPFLPQDSVPTTSQTVTTKQTSQQAFVVPQPRPLTPPPPAPQHQAAPAPEEKKAKRWLGANEKDFILEPPFKRPEGNDQNAQAPGSTGKQAAALFPPATWGTPVDPTRVLYASQVINGLLQHAVNSDQPGRILVTVTEEVTDKFAQGHVLLPQYTTLIAKQAGRPSYGQTSLPITVERAELPDGSVLALPGTQLGESGGSTGVQGQVNNHYGKLGLAAILTATLSIGSRSVGGNTQGYQPTLTQEFAKDIGGSVNRTGQQIIDRELNIPPTIMIPAGTPITVQLSENVSLQTPPTIVRQ
jgi:type IV secretory pathway VirB10-like protein